MKPVIDYVHSKGPSAAPSDSPQFPSACLSVQCLTRRGLCHDIGKRRTHARRQARRVRAQCTRRALSPSRMPAGLAFGLYTCGGTKTCVGGRVGSVRRPAMTRATHTPDVCTYAREHAHTPGRHGAWCGTLFFLSPWGAR